MSYSPNGFGLKLPTAAGCSTAATPTQPLQLATPGSSSSPHQYLVWVPPRAAYSHSASVGRRYGLWVAPASQPAHSLASFQLISVMGTSSLPVPTNWQALAAAHAFHSRTEIG